MSKKILIVDDEEDVVDVVKVVLESEGYEVITSENGKKALEVLKTQHPDLIILDIMMPEMDGVEVCSRLRKMEKMNDVPIVMFSAKLSAVDKKESFDAGADGFITKPFNTKGFTTSIRTYLELGRI